MKLEWLWRRSSDRVALALAEMLGGVAESQLRMLSLKGSETDEEVLAVCEALPELRPFIRSLRAAARKVTTRDGDARKLVEAVLQLAIANTAERKTSETRESRRKEELTFRRLVARQDVLARNYEKWKRRRDAGEFQDRCQVLALRHLRGPEPELDDFHYSVMADQLEAFARETLGEAYARIGLCRAVKTRVRAPAAARLGRPRYAREHSKSLGGDREVEAVERSSGFLRRLFPHSRARRQTLGVFRCCEPKND